MKTVFSSHSAICHAFANLNEDERLTRSGRSTNIFFDSGRIFSYGRHFEMGRFHKKADGSWIVVLTDDTYSVSTGKHQSRLRSAVSQYGLVFVPTSSSESVSVSVWKGRIQAAQAKLAKGRKPEIYTLELSRIFSQITRAYGEFYGKPVPSELLELFGDAVSPEDLQAAKDYAKSQKRKAQAEIAKRVRAWKSGEKEYISNTGEFSYLRVDPRGFVETSQAVTIPNDAARELFKTIKRLRDAKKLENLMGLGTFRGYKIHSANQRRIRIGCHLFEVSELIETGERLQAAFNVETEAIAETLNA